MLLFCLADLFFRWCHSGSKIGILATGQIPFWSPRAIEGSNMTWLRPQQVSDTFVMRAPLID